MLKLFGFVLALSYVASAQTCQGIKMNIQNDLPTWDFEKEQSQSNDNALKPYDPQCEFLEGALSVREAFEGDWSCIVDNKSGDNYVVRVQTTENDDNPQKDGAWDFYYYAPAGRLTLANPGKAGDNEVCRLCGAKKVTATGLDWNGIKALEQRTYDFQCRRRCQAVLYMHRNFNGQSMTIASNIADLGSFNLKNPPHVSSLKIYGKGCELRMWENPGFNRQSGQDQSPVCSFKANNDISTWDMDAMRKACCNSRCPTGQDCFQSVSIRDTSKCGPQSSIDSATGKPSGCGSQGCYKPERNDVATTAHVSQSARVQALERLFKAMAQVLE